MHLFSLGVAWLVAAAIIGIGAMYLFNPFAMIGSFGLPLPEEGRNVGWWLRLKGMRDIASGLIVIAMLTSGTPFLLGVVLLIEAAIPLSDMSLILAARGSARTALSVHGLTALLMILAGLPLTLGITA